MVITAAEAASKYKEFKFSWKHYSEHAYDTAVSKLTENEYIIKKENDLGNEMSYCVTFITNMGNIIYVDSAGKRNGIKFGYSSQLEQQPTTENTILHNKIIDKIIEYKFCKNGNGHYSKLQKELNELIILVRSMMS